MRRQSDLILDVLALRTRAELDTIHEGICEVCSALARLDVCFVDAEQIMMCRDCGDAMYRRRPKPSTPPFWSRIKRAFK